VSMPFAWRRQMLLHARLLISSVGSRLPVRAFRDGDATDVQQWIAGHIYLSHRGAFRSIRLGNNKPRCSCRFCYPRSQEAVNEIVREIYYTIDDHLLPQAAAVFRWGKSN
jgi:hypothetical protein